MTDDENVTSLDARIAAGNPTLSHQYPRSTRVHGQWQDGRIQPARVDIHFGPTEHELAKVKRDDRRKIVLLVLAALIVVAIAALLLIRTPGVDANQPSRSQVRCNLAHQVGEPCRP